MGATKGEFVRTPASSVLVVLPTYEEASNLMTVLERLRLALPDAMVLVIDDNSPDGTAQLAQEAAATMGEIDVIVRPNKLGLGSAYVVGFKRAVQKGFATVVEMDSDLSHDPADVPKLLRAIAEGADLAIGSRYVAGGSIVRWAPHRRGLSRLGNWYARRALRLNLLDLTSGLRAYRVDVLDVVGLHSIRAGGYAFQVEMAYRVARAGGSIVEIPVQFGDRAHGFSKMSFGIAFEAIVLVTYWALRDRISDIRRITNSADLSLHGRRSKDCLTGQ